MPPHHYPRRDSNPRQRTEPWQIRSSSVKILTSVLSRKPEYGIARPSRKWFLRQEKRMRNFPDELLSITGKRNYNRISAGSAVLETMQDVLRRITSSSSTTARKDKAKDEGTIDGGEEELKRWKKSKANLCTIHEVLDAHLMHRIFMAIAHETSTLTYVLRGFISEEISAIEKSTEGHQGYGQRSRSKSETTLVKHEGVTRLAALLHRLDSITAYWVNHKTFAKNFHGGKPYDESGRMTQVENRCDACILAAIGADATALCDLRALALYRQEKRRRSFSTGDELGQHNNCVGFGITESSSSNRKPTSPNGRRVSPIRSQTSIISRSQPSFLSDDSSRSRSQEPVLLRFLDGWISALKKDQPETCRSESKYLAALLSRYQARIELYRSEHARLRSAGAEAPTIWREVRVTRAVSRSTGRRREELFDLVPCQEEVEFGNHTRYGTPIAYLIPSSLREGKGHGPKYHGYCNFKDDNMGESSTKSSPVAGCAIDSGIGESERNSSQSLSVPSRNEFQAFMERSQALYGEIDPASSSVYSQNGSDELEHESNKNSGVPNCSVEDISIFLDEREVRRLAQSETVVRDWQARCNLDKPQPVPPKDVEDSNDELCARPQGLYKDKLPVTKALVPLLTPRTNIPSTPFTHHSAVPHPLSLKSKASDDDAQYLLQEAGQHIHHKRSFFSAFASRKRSENLKSKSVLMKQTEVQCRFCSGSRCKSCAPFASDLGSSSVMVPDPAPTDIPTKEIDQKSSERVFPLGHDDCVVDFENYNDRASAWTDVSVHTRCQTITSTLNKRDGALKRVTEEQTPQLRSQGIVEKTKKISQLGDDSLELEKMVGEKLGRLEDLHITPEQEALVMNLPNMKPSRTDFCPKAFGETSTVYKFPMHPEVPDDLASIGVRGHSPQISPRQIVHDSAYQCPETPQVLKKRIYNTDRPSYQAWLKNIRSLDNIRDTPLKPSDTTVDSYYPSRTASRYEQVGTPTKSRLDGQKATPRLETVLEPDGLQDWERHGIERSRDWEEIGVPPVRHVSKPGHMAPPPLKLRSFLDRLIDSKKATETRKGKGPITTTKQVDDRKRNQTTPRRPPLQISTSTSNGFNVATRGRGASILHAGQCQPSRPKRPPRIPPAEESSAEYENKEGSVRAESYATQITDLLAQWQHETSSGKAERRSGSEECDH